jgi:sodium pump decarboxylase gamma subunit
VDEVDVGSIIVTSLKVMVLGMGTVFIALIGLIIIVELLNKIINIGEKTKKSPDTVDRAFETVISMEENRLENKIGNDIEENPEELVAIISAAIAASLERSTHDIVVRSIRRVPATTPVWNRVSRQEQIATRLY